MWFISQHTLVTECQLAVESEISLLGLKNWN